MSVMLLSDSEIIAIASFATHNYINFDGQYLQSITHNETSIKISMQRTAEVLQDANVKSFNARYNENETITVEVSPAHAAMTPPDPHAIARSVNTLIYNSDEYPEWESTTAKRVIFEIQTKLLSLIVGFDKFESYPQFEHDVAAELDKMVESILRNDPEIFDGLDANELIDEAIQTKHFDPLTVTAPEIRRSIERVTALLQTEVMTDDNAPAV